MRSRIFNKINRCIYTELLLCLTFASLFCVGFSSWIIANDVASNEVRISIGSFGNKTLDTKGSAYFVRGSEEGFETFSFNEAIKYSSTVFSCQIKVKPSLLKSTFDTSNVDISIGLTYDYRTSLNRNLFANNNILIPDTISFSVVNSNNRKINSLNRIVSSEEKNGGITSYRLMYSVPLYSKEESSVYEMCKEFESSFDFVFVNVFIPFIINDNAISLFKDIKFNFLTNLEEN